MTALHYIYAQVKALVIADTQLITFFNGVQPKIDVGMGARNGEVLYINYLIRLRADDESDMKNGRLNFSVYVYDRNPILCEEIADRLQKLFNHRYFPDLVGVANSIRTYATYNYQAMPTESEEVQRMDVSIPIRYLDCSSSDGEDKPLMDRLETVLKALSKNTEWFHTQNISLGFLEVPALEEINMDVPSMAFIMDAGEENPDLLFLDEKTAQAIVDKFTAWIKKRQITPTVKWTGEFPSL